MSSSTTLRGINRLIINQETMVAAVNYWLGAVLDDTENVVCDGVKAYNHVDGNFELELIENTVEKEANK